MREAGASLFFAPKLFCFAPGTQKPLATAGGFYRIFDCVFVRSFAKAQLQVLAG
jgi:hypothetical protein